MRLEQSIPERLFPIQPKIIYEKYLRVKKSNEENSAIKRIPVVDYNQGFLMLDGHTTSSFLIYSRNKRMLDIEIQENDDEALFYFKGALNGIRTIPEFIQKYEKEFRARCEKESVFNILDLKPPIRNEKRRSYFC